MAGMKRTAPVAVRWVWGEGTSRGTQRLVVDDNSAVCIFLLIGDDRVGRGRRVVHDDKTVGEALGSEDDTITCPWAVSSSS